MTEPTTDCTCSRTCKGDRERICQAAEAMDCGVGGLHLTLVSDDDWHALYFNGADTAVEQNHSLNLVDVLGALIGKTVASVASFEVNSQEGEAEWMGGRGFPHYLSDIPQEARIT